MKCHVLSNAALSTWKLYQEMIEDSQGVFLENGSLSICQVHQSFCSTSRLAGSITTWNNILVLNRPGYHIEPMKNFSKSRQVARRTCGRRLILPPSSTSKVIGEKLRVFLIHICTAFKWACRRRKSVSDVRTQCVFSLKFEINRLRMVEISLRLLDTINTKQPISKQENTEDLSCCPLEGDSMLGKVIEVIFPCLFGEMPEPKTSTSLFSRSWGRQCPSFAICGCHRSLQQTSVVFMQSRTMATAQQLHRSTIRQLLQMFSEKSIKPYWKYNQYHTPNHFIVSRRLSLWESIHGSPTPTVKVAVNAHFG